MSAMKIARKPGPKNIVVLRALQLGDLLNAVPAFRALRAAYPRSRITLVGLPWAEEFVDRFRSYLDGFIPFPGFPGFPEQEPAISALPAFLNEMQANRFDLAIQMQGSGEISNPLIRLWAAKQTAGFYRPGSYCPDENLFLEYPQGEPEAWRHLRLMQFLGIPLQGDHLEMPLYAQDWKQLEKIRQTHSLQSRYVCIHPGARAAVRRWPVKHFASLADCLAAEGFQVVLTGTAEEAELARGVARHMKAPAINLAGKTDLGALAALVSQAHLVFCNDTGVSHVAAALKTPSVVLFADAKSVRWAPRNRQLHKSVWQAMDMKADEVLAQVQQHLEAVYAPGLEPKSQDQAYAFDLIDTGGRSEL